MSASNNMSIEYRFDLLRNNEKKAQLVEVRNITYGYKRNAFVVANFTHNANNLEPTVKANLIKGSELQIFRKGEFDTELRLIFAGEISSVKKTINAENVKTLNIGVVPWGAVFLNKRIVSKTFVSIEESTIAGDLITETNTDTFSGTYTASQVDTGITIGTLETTGNSRSRTYTDEVILKNLQQLAELEDLSPNPQKIRGFRLSPDLITSTSRVFSYLKDYGIERDVTYLNNTIDSITEDSEIISLLNRVTANGKTGTTPQSATTTDQAHLDFFKLRHGFISKTNVETDSTLLEEAELEVDTRITSTSVFSIMLVKNDPFTGQYREGDIINIKFVDDESFIVLDGQFRVHEITITLNENNEEQTSIKIVAENDKAVSLDVEIASRLGDNIRNSNERLTNLEK